MRRLLIPVFTALGLIGALGVAGPGTPPATLGQAAAAQARPNIVVIETDDQTQRSIGFMPRVNSLIGDQGARFTNNFVNYSTCCPSRSTFLTGQYMHNHGVLYNSGPQGGFYRFHSTHANNNLAVWLRRAGYYTAMVGKYLNGYWFDPPVPPGWSEWYATQPDIHQYYDYMLDVNGARVHYGEAPTDYRTDVLTQKAVSFVARRTPKPAPFFLWLTYTAPHQGGPYRDPNRPFNCSGGPKPAPRHAYGFDSQPLPRPPNFNEADVSDKPAKIRDLPRLSAGRISDIQRLYRCELESLLSVDEGVKRLVDTLRNKGELDNTLIAYTADNGFFHGEHRIPEQKRHIYEESIRVPLQMRGPGIPAGINVSDLAINADLAPTIVDVANASPGLVMDGRSLIPVAQNPGIERERELLIEEPIFKAIRTKRYMYATHGTGEKELYDLQTDPFQLVSRHNHPAYASVRAQLASDLQKLKSCAGSSCRLHFTP